MAKKMKVQGKNYIISGYTKGALPLAKARRVYSKQKQKTMGKKTFIVKNLSIRRKLARLSGY